MERGVDGLRGTGWYGAEGGCVDGKGIDMELRVDLLRRTGLVWS